MNILLIDNGNLFSHSLAALFEKKKCQVTMFSSTTEFSVLEGHIKKERPSLIVLAPGVEVHSALLRDIIRRYSTIPLFGVGSGLQMIVEAYEGRVDRAVSVMHGKTCRIHHDNKGVFRGLPLPFTAGRYNALAAVELPRELEVSGRDEQNTIMAIRHKELPIEAVQFHPESILTPSGSQLIDNVLLMVRK